MRLVRGSCWNSGVPVKPINAALGSPVACCARACPPAGDAQLSLWHALWLPGPVPRAKANRSALRIGLAAPRAWGRYLCLPVYGASLPWVPGSAAPHVRRGNGRYGRRPNRQAGSLPHTTGAPAPLSSLRDCANALRSLQETELHPDSGWATPRNRKRSATQDTNSPNRTPPPPAALITNY